MTDQPILVLGAMGSFGGAVVDELLHRGRTVRAMLRYPRKARWGEAQRVSVVPGDAEDPSAIRRAADGVAVIVHGVSYPYHRWQPHMMTVTRNVVAAARSDGARIVFPGNVYGLSDQRGMLDEGAANRAESVKGRLRIALEDALRQGAGSGAPVLIVRAGDFFGPTALNGLVDRVFGAAAAGRTIQAIGNLEAAHEWMFLPDLARATIDLLDQAEHLAAFAVVHVPATLHARSEPFWLWSPSAPDIRGSASP